jgi:hypothetical protein
MPGNPQMNKPITIITPEIRLRPIRLQKSLLTP